MMSSILIFVALCFCAIVHAAEVSVVQEPATQHTFSSSMQQGMRKLTLAGVGVRIKTIGPIKAKVYSAGIYVDKGKIVSQCKVLKCTTEKELINSTEFENTVVEGSGDKNIVLRMARSVGAEAMVSAVESSVKPRMKGKDSGALQRFSSILLEGLKDGGAKNNMVFSFENTGNVKMSIVIDGKKRGDVQSPTLCRAFSSVYLGADSVSPTLKTNVARTLLGWKDI